MTSGTERQQSEVDQSDQDRWSNILQQVHGESVTGRHWYQEVGIFLAWAAGIALAIGIITIVLLLIVDLFSKERLFGARTASDWMFWASALLLFSGLLAPSASDIKESSSTKRSGSRQRTSATQRSSSTRRSSQLQQPSVESPEDQRTRAIRRRLQRVYNPWRWRLWASAAFSFGLSVLVGLLA